MRFFILSFFSQSPEDIVAVKWNGMPPVYEKKSNLEIVDRTFLLSDAVTLRDSRFLQRNKSVSRQRGCIIKVEDFVDLRFVRSGYTVYGVHSSLIVDHLPISDDFLVHWNGGFGTVHNLHLRIVVRFDEGGGIAIITNPSDGFIRRLSLNSFEEKIVQGEVCITLLTISLDICVACRNS